MNPLRWPSVVLWLTVCCALGTVAAGARASEADRLAGQAQEVFARHCSACHASTKGQAGLNVFDRKQLLERGLINAKRPAASELIDLIQSGAMPPGTNKKVSAADQKALLAWIQAGTPEESRSAYVLRHQLRDWKKLPGERKPHARYLSLAHLAGPESSERLGAFREELTALLAYFTSPKKKAAKVEPIDTANLIYRIDLEALGWDAKPFKDRDALSEDEQIRKKRNPSRINLYDLLVLEYPYGSLPFSSHQFEEVRTYLKEAKPVRPVPYLRADWLVGQLASGKLSDELALLLEVKGKKPESPVGLRFREGRVTAKEARAEVGWTGDEKQLDKALEDDGLKGLADDKGVSRAEWESAHPGVIRRLGVEKPILPLDGLDAPGSLAHRPVHPSLKVVTVDVNNGDPKQEFEAGGPMGVEVSAKLDVTYELFWLTPEIYPRGLQQLDPKKKVDSFPIKKLGQDLGTEHWLVVAFPTKVLPKPSDFPRGMELSGVGGVRPRFIHPFYRLTADGKGFEGPAVEEIIVAKTAFKIVAPKR